MTLLDEPKTATAWVPVCRLGALQPGRGVTALVEGRPVGLFRLDDDRVHAIDAVDPRAGVAVLARGLVGTTVHGGDLVHYVASPLRKERYDLATGGELGGDHQVATYPVQVTDGVVTVGVEASWSGNEAETGP